MKSLLSITEIDNKLDRDNFKAYFLVSTAQTTVEAEKKDIYAKKPSAKIEEMVQHILEAKKKNPQVRVDVVVQIHGYNTGDSYKNDYKKAQAEMLNIQEHDNSTGNIVIYLGYAWPSEKFAFTNPVFAYNSWKSLTLWLHILSAISIVWISMHMSTNFNGFVHSISDLIYLVLNDILKWFSTTVNLSNSFIDAIAEILGSFHPYVKYAIKILLWATTFFPILTIVLMLLRASVYFRDSYRATHYGVPDLVQFFRAFEYVLINKQDSQELEPTQKLSSQNLEDRYHKFFEDNRIKLSFIGHSMGGFVVTNLVRILSDVFDRIDSPDSEESAQKNDALSVIDGERIVSKEKRSKIGKCFSLERLILISPDIPVNAILSGRSNFLSSSLSRFQESYLFSNEGDMVLLLLSTVANYISFPSTTSQMGYKLGNLGVDNGKIGSEQYNVSEFSRINNQACVKNTGNILGSLVIGIEHKNLPKLDDSIPFVAQEFTYFDCTNYLRAKLSFFNSAKKLRRYKPLTFLDYFLLIPHLSGTHGGYFDYSETHEAIYTIACKGFKHFQTSKTWDKIEDGVGIKVLKVAELCTCMTEENNNPSDPKRKV